MTRQTNARIAGFTFLAYIAAGLTSMAISGRATRGDGIADKLATLTHHATDVGFVVLLSLVMSFAAFTLGVTLWSLTREQDPDLAMMGLVCRVSEGILGSGSVPANLALLWLATSLGGGTADAGAAHLLGSYLLRGDAAFTAIFFAVGSALFSWLLLRGRLIPSTLAGLGVVASLLLVALLPLQVAGFLRGPITLYAWLPMLAFELLLSGWLLVRGVAAPAAG